MKTMKMKKKLSVLLALVLVVTGVFGLYTVSAAAADSDPFWDVRQGQWFYETVQWAVDKGITNGMDRRETRNGVTKDYFEPDTTCTYAQILTFMYRVKGSPDVSNIKISDVQWKHPQVNDGAWYTNPIKWAHSKGMISYLGNFNPNAGCPRRDVAMFMYFANGYTVDDNSKFSTTFSDVTKEYDYYKGAIGWAEQNGISNGMDDAAHTFGVNRTCTRAQIVTFLSRYANVGNKPVETVTPTPTPTPVVDTCDHHWKQVSTDDSYNQVVKCNSCGKTLTLDWDSFPDRNAYTRLREYAMSKGFIVTLDAGGAVEDATLSRWEDREEESVASGCKAIDIIAQKCTPDQTAITIELTGGGAIHYQLVKDYIK